MYITNRVTVILFICIKLGYTLPSSNRVKNYTLSNSNLKNIVTNLESPVVGAFRKSFKGETTKVIGAESNSEVSLPELRYEDHTWEGISIELECNASYPVRWIYSGIGSPPVHTNTYRIATNFFDEKSYTFRATVTFTHTTNVATGNYTCQSIENPELHSYLYVFVPGNGIFMADVEETEIVVADFNSPWVTLPCSVSDADAKVVLLKKHPNGGLEVLRLNSHVTFDPKIGFQLQWRSLSQPWADYVCIATSDDNTEQLDVTLVKPQNLGKVTSDLTTSEEDNMEIGSKLPKQSGVYFIQDARHNRIVCCSSTNERPVLRGTGCSSIAECELRLPYLRAKKCPPTCEQHISNIGRTCVGYELGEWKDNGILECSLPGTNVRKTHMYSKDEDTIINQFDHSQNAKETVLKLYSENSPIKGKLFVSCHANPFFFSHGLKWAWKRPNGKLELIDEPHYPAATHLEVDKDSNIGSSLYCFAPVWNSSKEWKSESIVIK